MMDNDILELLEDIGRSSVARLSPSTYLAGDNAQARRDQVLSAIRGTILPRRLEFTAADGAVLAIEVNSSRITDVFTCASEPAPDFETHSREDLTELLAQLVSEISTAAGPLELVSLQPDEALEADDVGITYSEIAAACAKIDLPEEPRMSIVPDPEPDVEADAPNTSGIAEQFYDGSSRFALGRVLMASDDEDPTVDGLCAPDQPAYTKKDLLSRFARDLSGWSKDGADVVPYPQLIVMRPSGGHGAGLAVLSDGQQTAAAVHDARKLGAVVNLWRSLKSAVE